MSLCVNAANVPFWIVAQQLVFTWTDGKLKVVTYS